ncbi:RagB/SusD family nutrient uptake outer membrane protein [Salegentibacter sp. LM13S]|uniref:RagB/SusD family nutrient uptake outer membrane protein n=1 Tax=Salegentibacter lacus TaxID=2873599 RepID=UPI001CCDDFF6|nr:RagB/SusD family nutrient uptake outer membrane protein [Salegentibacter lacus]MBZ9631552.1 RagB/SusD family nutrient uptake outer membrane protein [Salegentibacter lacus]
MFIKKRIKQIIVVFLASILIACEDFVEVDAPDYKIIRDDVFSSEETAKSAMTGIYNELFRSSFSNGTQYSVTVLGALSGNLLKNIRETNLTRMEFQQHEITPENTSNLFLWTSAYNMIYMTNAFLEGLQSSEKISSEVKNQLQGEAKFVRAFTYFYLVNLYGDVPLVLTTDYEQNELASRTYSEEIYTQIILDLEDAIEVLTSENQDIRTKVNRYTAMALLARVHLYNQQWQKAEELSSQVISNNSYILLEELNDVFLANSQEAIWQISPVGSGAATTHTNEGNFFIIDPVFSFLASVKLDENFIENFSEEDLRLSTWISYNESLNAYFPFKYKIWNSNEQPSTEYSMVLRLAEQFLIRAEARLMQDNFTGAIEDINTIRNRAGLAPLSNTDNLETEVLLDELMEQRSKEIFTEWGHRWLDLKRTGRYEHIWENNPLWEETDLRYPIPADERIKNPNLTQNPGY